MSLTTQLLLRITLVGLLCWLGLSTAMVLRLQQDGQQVIDSQADRLQQLAEMQLRRQLIALDAGTRVPDLARVAANFGRPVCLRYLGFDVSEEVSWGCDDGAASGVPAARPAAPRWLDDWLEQSGALPREVQRTITLWSVRDGTLTVVPARAAVIEGLWQRLRDLAGLTAATILAVNTLVLLSLRRMLRPTGEAVRALDRLAHGDLTTPARPRGARELRRILSGIDALRQALAQLTAQRNTLTARLIDSQETERRDLARDLHDEMGQGLAALQALSGGLRMSAQAREPARLEDTDALDDTITQLHAGLRALLGRLRPPLLESQGPDFALRELVNAWNARQPRADGARPPLRAELSIPSQWPARLPEAVGLGLYRATQEALTNAARYAEASAPVQVILAVADGWVTLTVVNACAEASCGPARGSSLGLRMMGERIASLGGSLHAERRADGRFELRAGWPLREPAPAS